MNKLTHYSRIWGFWIFSLIILCGSINAQETQIKEKLTIPDSTNIQIIKTKDGSALIGRITEI